jgi:hypothetical protein
MKKLKVFCGKHFRRSVGYIPVIVPITIKYELNGKEFLRKDHEYQMRCPVCWDAGDREKTFKDFKQGRKKYGGL